MTSHLGEEPEAHPWVTWTQSWTRECGVALQPDAAFCRMCRSARPPHTLLPGLEYIPEHPFFCSGSLLCPHTLLAAWALCSYLGLFLFVCLLGFLPDCELLGGLVWTQGTQMGLTESREGVQTTLCPLYAYRKARMAGNVPSPEASIH